MVPEEQPTTTDGSTLHPPKHSSRRLLERRRVPGANKRTTLGALALAMGVAAATSVEGLVMGVPLVAAGYYLVADPLLAGRRGR